MYALCNNAVNDLINLLASIRLRRFPGPQVIVIACLTVTLFYISDYQHQPWPCRRRSQHCLMVFKAVQDVVQAIDGFGHRCCHL